MATFTVRQIADRVKGELAGSGDAVITGLSELAHSQPGQLTFVRDDKHAAAWAACRASAALVSKAVSITTDAARPIIRVADADLAVAAVLELFAPAPPQSATQPGAHPHATVDHTAQIDPTACIAAGARIGPRARIGAGSVIHSNVTIMDDVVIGARCVLFSGVVIGERCVLGDAVVLHPNVVIGGDGFGYRPSPDGRGLVKIPHIGNVIIENDVEIGSNSCVDRAKFSSTVVGAGTKIDNLCQIAHNCRVGRCCVIAGLTGLAGSVTMGDGVQVGGGVCFKDHVTVGSGAQVAGVSAVMNDIPAGEIWGGYPARPMHQAIREYAAMRRLPEMVKLMKRKSRD